MIMMSQQLLLLRPHPQSSLQEFPPKIPLLPPQNTTKRIIIHNQLQLLPQELDKMPQPQELLLLHPQLAADKSLIEFTSKKFFVMVYSMWGCLSMFPHFGKQFSYKFYTTYREKGCINSKIL